jgi:hypothetical protein
MARLAGCPSHWIGELCIGNRTDDLWSLRACSFHTIDIRRTDKDFEGWKVDRKIKFLDEFQHINQ